MIQEIKKNNENYNFIRQYLIMPSYETYMSKTNWQQLGFFVNGKLVGSILISNRNESCHVLFSAVLECYRGAAINKDLLKEVERLSKERGFNRITTNIRQSNIPSLKSFLGCGFLIYKADKHYKDGELKISLVKRLN